MPPRLGPYVFGSNGRIRSHAIALAGIHEAVYLELCERMRPLLPKT
jgi:hypothetical protein